MKFKKPFNVIYKGVEGNVPGVDMDIRVPIKLFMSEIDHGALQQLYNLARLPFAFHHIAEMPDGQKGYGMPIGGVLATKGYIIPNAVGNDIGCGMCAVRTSLFNGSLSKPLLKQIRRDIRKLIPVGYKHNKKPQEGMPDDINLDVDRNHIIYREWDSATKQLGTLGSGNHFIEIQAGNDGYIWVMIHSGSRNIGSKVAGHYNRLAIDLNEKWHSQVPKKWQLAFLPFNDELGQDYFNEMNYCCDFALANRKLMMKRVEEAMSNHVDVTFYYHDLINIHHNYAALEHHFGNNVLVHRKGATRAYEGELGIIPGSQGSKSYIVRGKGNPESFKSCSHGAGRLLGRKEAKRKLNLEDEKRKLDEQGIIHSVRSKKDLEEAMGAYKDIDVVMEHQKDLVDIVTELKPLAVVKG